MTTFNFTKHPMEILAGLSGANKITMTPSTCVALAFLLEAAADGIEGYGHQKNARMIVRLREHAANWRQTAERRV